MRRLAQGPDEDGIPRAVDVGNAVWPRWTLVRGQVLVYEGLPDGSRVASLWSRDLANPAAIFGPASADELQEQIIRRIVRGVR